MKTFYSRLIVLFVVLLLLLVKTVSSQNFHLVKDINTEKGSNSGGTNSAEIGYLTPLNNKIVFIANSGFGHTNFDLWSSDGTSAGTKVIKDTAVPNLFGPYPKAHIEVAGGNAYFFYKANGQAILFKTDGTSPGTIAIDTFNTATETVWDLGSTDSLFYFTVTKTVDNQQVTEIWRTDGIRANTFSMGQNPGYDQGVGYAGKSGKNLYFTVPNTIQTELWVTNGTQLGTIKLGPFIGFSRGYSYKDRFVFGGSKGLLSTDGTEGGFELLKNWLTYIEGFGIFNGMLFFTAHDEFGPYGDPGFGLYKTDGTAAGTTLIKQVYSFNLTDLNGVLYFFATDYSNNNTHTGLWKSDGTSEGTQLIKDFGSTKPGNMVAFNGYVYFPVIAPSYFDSSHISGLWESDGTDTGTHKVNDTGLTGVKVYSLAVAANKLFLSGTNDAYGNELWVKDTGRILPMLPLNLINFAGTLISNDGVLQWTITSGSINQVFELERSIDSIHFSTITQMNTSDVFSTKDYIYTDKNLNSLNVQRVYYRLKLPNIGGSVSYSKTVTLNLQKTNTELTVAPNPVEQSLRIVSSVAISEATIKIIDITGKVLITRNQNIAANSTVSINVSALSKGGYFVTVTSPAINYNFKIIKE